MIISFSRQRSPYLFNFYILFVENYDLGRQEKAFRNKTVRWTLHNFLYPIDWWAESSHFFNFISRFSIIENIVKTSYKEYVNNDLLVEHWQLKAWWRDLTVLLRIPTHSMWISSSIYLFADFLPCHPFNISSTSSILDISCHFYKNIFN